ncbi:MAG: hypothetical protein KAI24_21140 [Planctomycetes bacterium]|nr:hypothetical protein [Planctomycetota bacterium]
MNPIEAARSRRLDAILSEALRGDAPADLERRVLARLAAGRPVAASSPARGRGAKWLAAAALVLGCAIVFAVAGVDRRGGPAAAQDPKPLVVTTTEVIAGIDAVEAPDAGDARERLLALADGAGVDLAIAAGVKGRSASDLSGMSAQTAVRTIARDVGAHVVEFDGILAVGAPRRAAIRAPRVTLRTDVVDVREFVKQLHARCNVGFVVGGEVSGRLQLDVVDVPWRDLLDHVAERLGFRVVGHGELFALGKAEAKVSRRVFFNFRDSPFATVIDTCSKVAGLNTVVDPGLRGDVTVNVRDADPVEVVRATAACVGGVVVAGELVRLVPRDAGAKTATLTALACELGPQVQRWIGMMPRSTFEGEFDATAAVFVDRADVRELVRACATAAGRALEVDGGTYRLR